MLNHFFSEIDYSHAFGEHEPVKNAGRPPTATDQRAAMADRLKLMRGALFQSQAELSARTGITPAAWNNYEAGRNRISIDQALILCARVGVTLDWIYRGDASGLPVRIAELLGAYERQAGTVGKKSFK